MNDAVTVRAVTSRRDRRRFQSLPWTIYAGDPDWVPPILAQERLLLGWGRHPFFDNAEMVTLLAERGGKAVGRVAVFVNRVHNQKYDERRGFFGFFECIDDLAVARGLFDAGRAWLHGDYRTVRPATTSRRGRPWRRWSTQASPSTR